jgi:hypothetical protein
MLNKIRKIFRNKSKLAVTPGEQVRDSLIKAGIEAAKESVYAEGNVTEKVVDLAEKAGSVVDGSTKLVGGGEAAGSLGRKVGKFVLTLFSVAFVIGSAGIPTRAIDTTQAAKDVVASEGGKAALNEAFKAARSTPALTVAAAITCCACIPVAGAAASPGLCIACGILIAKVLG